MNRLSSPGHRPRRRSRPQSRRRPVRRAYGLPVSAQQRALMLASRDPSSTRSPHPSYPPIVRWRCSGLPAIYRGPKRMATRKWRHRWYAWFRRHADDAEHGNDREPVGGLGLSDGQENGQARQWTLAEMGVADVPGMCSAAAGLTVAGNPPWQSVRSDDGLHRGARTGPDGAGPPIIIWVSDATPA